MSDPPFQLADVGVTWTQDEGPADEAGPGRASKSLEWVDRFPRGIAPENAAYLIVELWKRQVGPRTLKRLNAADIEVTMQPRED